MALESGSLLKGFSLSKIVGGVNNTLNLVNRAIPIYKQVSPIVKNVRSAFSTVNSVREASKEAKVKEMKALERPVSVFKKANVSEERGKINMDTLTFFQ